MHAHATGVSPMDRLEPIDGDVSGERLAFAASLDQLAIEAYRRGRYRDACAQFLGSLAIRQEVLGSSSSEVADAFNNVGVTLRRLGQLGRARMHHERALEIRKRLMGTRHPDIASTLNNLGNVLMCQGEVDLASEHYARALEIREGAGLAETSGAIRLFTNLELAHQLRRRHRESPRTGPYLVRTGPTRAALPAPSRRSKALGSGGRGRAEASGEIARPTNAVPISKPVRPAPVLPRPGRMAPGQAGPVPYIETQKTNQIVITDERRRGRRRAFDPTPVVRPIARARTEQLDLDSEIVEIVEPPAPPPVHVAKATTEQLDLDSDLVEVIEDGGSGRLPAPASADPRPATLEWIPTPVPGRPRPSTVPIEPVEPLEALTSRDEAGSDRRGFVGTRSEQITRELLGDGFLDGLDAAPDDDDFLALEDAIVPPRAPPVPWSAIAVGVATGLAVMGVLALVF